MVKIINFKKFLFEQKKKRQLIKAVSSEEMKELRFSPGISVRDLEIRTEKARKFLKGGHPVRLTIQFRGREVVHPEIGQEKLNNALRVLADISKQDGAAKRFGNCLSVTIIPI